jgi:hypothetical protein
LLVATPAASGIKVGVAAPSISVTEFPDELLIHTFPEESIEIPDGAVKPLLV